MVKKKGNITYIGMGFFLVLFVSLYVIFATMTRRSEYISVVSQNALNLSTTSGFLVDLERLGLNGEIVVSDPHSSFYSFKQTLKTNLELDDTMKSKNTNIVSPISITRYIIYNCYNDGIKVVEINPENGEVLYETDFVEYNSLITPSGTVVTETTIYSEISFRIRNLYANSPISVSKWACVDIADD